MPTSARDLVSKATGSTWRVGELSNWAISRLIRTSKGILVGVVVVISLENNYLLSPPTLQVWIRLSSG